MAILSFNETFTTANGPVNGYNGWVQQIGSQSIVSNQLASSVAVNNTATHALSVVPQLPITLEATIKEGGRASGTPFYNCYITIGTVGAAFATSNSGAMMGLFSSGATRNLEIWDGGSLFLSTAIPFVFVTGDVLRINGSIASNGSGSCTYLVTSGPSTGQTQTTTWGARTWTNITGSNVLIYQETNNASFLSQIDNLTVTYNDPAVAATNNSLYAFGGV